MPVIKKRASVKTFLYFGENNDLSLFHRAWRLINTDGPLCPLPDPKLNAMSAELERMRRQQVHVDEIKRLCHVPVG